MRKENIMIAYLYIIIITQQSRKITFTTLCAWLWKIKKIVADFGAREYGVI